MSPVALFVYLQTLDCLTTLAGFKLGAQELNPLVRSFLHLGPVPGVIASKLATFAVIGMCLWMGKPRVVRRANYVFAALVLWNVGMLLRGLGAV